MKILLIRNDNLGDLICTTPAIEALRRNHPKARIDIVVNSYNLAGIYKNPFVDNIYFYTKPKHEKGFLKKAEAFFAKTIMMMELMQVGYDVCVVFRSSYSKSASLFAKVSKAPMRIGVKNKKGKDPFTHHVDPLAGRHEVEFCYECLKNLGVEIGGEKTLIIPKKEIKERFLRYKDRIIFHISSRVKENRLSRDSLLEIIKNLENPLITYEPSDKKLANSLGVEIVDTKNIDELIALLSFAKAVITLDGGVVHIAPALGRPTVAIFGKTDINRWYPWGYKEFCLHTQDERLGERVAENLLKLEKLQNG